MRGAGYLFGEMKHLQDSAVEAVTMAGERIEGRLVRLGRFDAVWTTSSCFDQLRTSQTLATLKITSDQRPLYEGRATVRKLVDTDEGLLCEVALDESGVNLETLPGLEHESFEEFRRQWLATYRISAEFKAVIADVSILLDNVRAWMNQVSIGIQAQEPKRAAEREREFLERVNTKVIASFNAQHERFEELAYAVSPELVGAHQQHAWRAWNSFFLSTPFGHRTFHKPLGYAGDYEMMAMIHRNAPEGNTLFNKAMHLLLVSQWPAESVRNRIAHLGDRLVNEVARAARAGRRARILNLGCGPAREVQEFMRHSALSDHADFVLLDFNEDTIQATGKNLQELKRSLGRRTGIEMRQQSVHQILRSAVASERKRASDTERCDLVYCAGLFDYLAAGTCKALVKLFHHWLAPGGLALAANMHDAKPFRNFIEYVLDWHLIYRNSGGMWAMCPEEMRAQAAVIAEPTTVNLFLEVRKPE